MGKACGAKARLLLALKACLQDAIAVFQDAIAVFQGGAAVHAPLWGLSWRRLPAGGRSGGGSGQWAAPTAATAGASRVAHFAVSNAGNGEADCLVHMGGEPGTGSAVTGSSRLLDSFAVPVFR